MIATDNAIKVLFVAIFFSTTALVTTLQSSFSLLSAAGFPIPQDVSYITEVLFCIRIKVFVGDKCSILALVHKKTSRCLSGYQQLYTFAGVKIISARRFLRAWYSSIF